MRGGDALFVLLGVDGLMVGWVSVRCSRSTLRLNEIFMYVKTRV